jgi:hypothetical protein
MSEREVMQRCIAEAPPGLRAEIRQQTKEQIMNGWGCWGPAGLLPLYVQYFCKQCDGELTPGPGGAGTNQVCEACRINYGCLPGALES